MNNVKIHGLLALWLSVSMAGQVHADSGLTTQFHANIVNNSCQITVTSNGQIHLGVVQTSMLTTLPPAEYSTGTSFSIIVNECGQSTSRTATHLHLSFQPQSGVFPTKSKQAFTNDQNVSAGGAENIGVAVFDDQSRKNVLNADGSSDVIKSTSSGSTPWIYNFSARIQPVGDEISPGFILSNVLVDVYYD